MGRSRGASGPNAGRGLPTPSPSANLVGERKDVVPEGLALSSVKQILVGRPIPSHLAHHERLSKTTGLAVLSSDALSSVAYATEEIVRTLIPGRCGGPVVVHAHRLRHRGPSPRGGFSYRQTIHAYPNGGGAYVVAKETSATSPASSPRGPSSSTTS